MDVIVEALILKNVELDCEAIHLPKILKQNDKNRAYYIRLKIIIVIPINVFPVPGGPKSKMPLGGLRIPLKISGLRRGQITDS